MVQKQSNFPGPGPRHHLLDTSAKLVGTPRSSILLTSFEGVKGSTFFFKYSSDVCSAHTTYSLNMFGNGSNIIIYDLDGVPFRVSKTKIFTVKNWQEVQSCSMMDS